MSWLRRPCMSTTKRHPAGVVLELGAVQADGQAGEAIRVLPGIELTGPRTKGRRWPLLR